MRFLIAPRPGNAGGPEIFLKRLAGELVRRGYQWTSAPFKYLGFSPIPWRQAIIMNAPRHKEYILNRVKPVLAVMGQPYVQEHCAGMGIPYLPKYEVQQLRMLDSICKAPKVVFISGYVRALWAETFSKRGLPFPEKKSIISYHGVDINHFHPPQERPHKPFVLGSAGALRADFRLATLFQTSRLLDFEHQLLIVGSLDTACQHEFAKAMADPVLKARTTYVPWVDAAALPQYYEKMHCLFHPLWADACPSVVAEALACGVPVVVPEFGGPAEFVLPEGGVAITGKRWDYGEDFCRRMAHAVTQVRDNWENFSLGARKQAEQHLSLEKMTDAYLDHMELPRNFS